MLDSTHHRDDLNITVKQPLYDLGIFADIQVSRSKEDVALAEKIDIGDGVANDTTNAFFGLLQSQVGMHLAEQYIVYLRKLEATMAVRVEGGGASEADLQRIKGRTLMAEAALLEAQGEYQTGAMEFSRLTGTAPVALRIPDMLAPSTPARIDDAIDRAMQGNLSYRGALRKVELAEHERTKMRSALAPKISLEYTDSYSYNAGGVALGNPTDGLFPTQKIQSLMVVAQWTIYGGNAFAGSASASAKIREMDFRAADMRERITQGVQAAYTAINAAKRRRDILARNVETNSSVAKAFEEQFVSGGRSLFDLIDSYEQLYNARLNLVRATIAGTKAVYMLHRLMGDIVPSVMAMGSN